MLDHGALHDGVGFVCRPLGTVVGHEAHECVVELADRVQVRNDFADVGVDAFDHCGEDFHRPRGFGTVPVCHVFPFFDFVCYDRMGLDVLRNHA